MGQSDRTINEAADRLREELDQVVQDDRLLGYLEAALATERRNVVAEIREPLVELSALAGHAAHLVDRITSALEESEKESDR